MSTIVSNSHSGIKLLRGRLVWDLLPRTPIPISRMLVVMQFSHFFSDSMPDPRNNGNTDVQSEGLFTLSPRRLHRGVDFYLFVAHYDIHFAA